MKLRNIHILTGMISLFAFCLNPSTVEAVFASVKSTGMAATCISYPLDTLVGAYNPAGMPEIGDRIDVEAGWVQDWGHTRIHDNMTPIVAPLINGRFDGMRTKYVFPVNFGFNKDWCLGDDWVLSTGIILYNRNYQKTTYKRPLILLGTSNPGLEYLHETIAPIVAIQWCNRHSIGIAINYQVERLKVNGLQNFDRPVFPGIPGGSLFPGHVTNRGYDYSTGWGVTIGYLGHITDCLSIGVTYQPKTSMSRMNKYKGFLAHKGKLDIPAKYGAGISYRVLPELIVAFDVEFIQWDQIKALHNPLLHNGTLAPLGSKHGPGFGFRNQVYYRFGVEWQLNDCIALRLGYRYANTPVKRTQTAVNLLTLDVVQSFITAGGTWAITECQEISFLGAYGFGHTVKGKNSIPVFLGSGEADLHEQKFAIGLAWGYNF